MQDAPTPDEVIMKLLEFQKEKKEEPFRELPEQILEMKEGRTKRLWIFLYFLIRLHGGTSDEKIIQIIENLKRIEGKELSKEEEELYIWTEEQEEINPRILATTSIYRIRIAFTSVQKRILYKSYPKLREVFRRLAQLGDIPDTSEILSSLPLVNYRIACYVMKHAWNKIIGIPLDRGAARVMARLGWMDEKEYNSFNRKINSQKIRVNHLFRYNTWKHVYPALKRHSESICFVGKGQEPACERCPLNKMCPSSSVTRGVHMYLNTLQEQGYFPETKEEKKKEMPQELASCTESESEDFSDIE